MCVFSHFNRILLCNTLACRWPGFSVHGILQARKLEWIAMPPAGNLPHPGIEPTPQMSPALAGGFFITRTTWEALLEYR